MKLSKLCAGASVKRFVNVDFEKEINHLTNDYKTAENSSVFFAIKGETYNGNDFAAAVLKKGGVVVSDSANYAKNILVSGGKNLIYVNDARSAMSKFAANYNLNPQEKLKIIMVVGTNGKTSTACIIRDIFEYSGVRTGIIGTLETRFEDVIFQNELTTPDPIQLFEIFKSMQEKGAKVVVMEGSAHAIALKKLQNITADIAVFTNFSQDHLDFFGDMQSYAEVKKSLFNKDNVKTAVVNADDVLGREIIASAQVPTLSYGIENVSDVFCIFSSDVQKFAGKISSMQSVYQLGGDGDFVVNYLDEICDIKTQLKGRFNTYNLLGAITAARYFGIGLESIKSGVAKISNIAGRYQEVENKRGMNIVVDYAHTPDGMENILKEMKRALKNPNENRLICIFGCGGNRDNSKREPMGAAAEKYSDLIIITSDNPRFEDAHEIAAEILRGIENKDKTMIIINREAAISYAISIAKSGDSIAILGKGHEEYIDENGEKRYFSDVETVKKYI